MRKQEKAAPRTYMPAQIQLKTVKMVEIEYATRLVR